MSTLELFGPQFVTAMDIDKSRSYLHVARAIGIAVSGDGLLLA